MKRLLDIAIAVIILAMAVAVFLTKPAHADEVQPNETFYDARCRAATQALDYEGVKVYCIIAAENHGTDAALESGSVRCLDTVHEAADLILIGLARDATSDGDSKYLYNSARQLLQSTQQMTCDPAIRRIVQIDLHKYPL